MNSNPPYVNPGARAWVCPAPDRAARAFHRLLPGYRPTPLVETPSLAARLGVGRVLVKDESQRFDLRAFKMLGASWATYRCLCTRAGGSLGTGGAAPRDLAEIRRTAATMAPLRLVTATDGNHGRAVARMAGWLDLAAHVFVPADTSLAVVGAIAGEGARVTTVDGDYDVAVRAAAAQAEVDDDAVLVQDTAWPGYELVPSWVVAGYLTLFTELDEQMLAFGGDIDLVSVPVGVGSLAHAALAHYRSRDGARPAVLGVEPQVAACVLASLRRGELCSVTTAATSMAGLNCGTPSLIAWPYLQQGLDAAVAVSDEQAASAAAAMHAAGISAGPSGAASLAGVDALVAGTARAEGRAIVRGARGSRGSPGCGPGDLGPASTVVLVSTEGAHAS